jgi:SAM-dependent methyltransferase
MASAADYGDGMADIYDEIYPEAEDARVAAAALAELAGDGPALELGIGTGRIALPLAGLGVEVHGIDASEPMIEKLRSKPGGQTIPVAVGDFSQDPLGGPFSLVYVPFNTLFGLTDQESQIRCFANVAASLSPKGRFVAELFVPDLGRFDRGQRTSLVSFDANSVMLDVARHDLASQTIEAAHVWLSPPGGVRIQPVNIRYAWPGELDLMARLAGLDLEHRWSSWKREPFDSSAMRHISVWQLR